MHLLPLKNIDYLIVAIMWKNSQAKLIVYYKEKVLLRQVLLEHY